jgi:hypothetical protein
MSDSFKELAVLTKIHHTSGTQNNKIALFILVTLGISIFNLLLLLFQAISLNGVSHRPMPTMVQLVNGKTIEVKAFEGKDRSPQLIKDFTVSSLNKLFTWRYFLPATASDDPRRPQLDPGVPVESKTGKVLIPTSVWGGSWTLADKFREEFLGASIAPLMSQLQILQGKSEVAFIPLDIQDPAEVKGDGNERLWKIQIVANLVYRATSDASEKVVPFNKTVYLRAVEPPSLPEVDSATSKDRKDLARVIATARSAGLEIYAIEDYTAQDSKPILPNLNPTTPPTDSENPTPVPTQSPLAR